MHIRQYPPWELIHKTWVMKKKKKIKKKSQHSKGCIFKHRHKAAHDTELKPACRQFPFRMKQNTAICVDWLFITLHSLEIKTAQTPGLSDLMTLRDILTSRTDENDV